MRILRRHGSAVDPAWHQRIDLAVISHSHWDHFDLESLRIVGTETPVIVPRGAGSTVRQAGFQRVTELAAGGSVDVDGLTVEATRARHTGFAPPFGPTDRSIGLLFHLRQPVYFAGDTDLFPEMADLSGRMAVALLPVWGWGPILRGEHLDPKRAAEALTMLRPRVAVPIHWGTIHPVGLRWLRPHTRRDPPHAFQAFARVLAPDVDVRVLFPGHATEVA
jgi:L-ascorbate metabolism protein UlaG (beta-lactamase superfamily)